MRRLPIMIAVIVFLCAAGVSAGERTYRVISKTTSRGEFNVDSRTIRGEFPVFGKKLSWQDLPAKPWLPENGPLDADGDVKVEAVVTNTKQTAPLKIYAIKIQSAETSRGDGLDTEHESYSIEGEGSYAIEGSANIPVAASLHLVRKIQPSLWLGSDKQEILTEEMDIAWASWK